MDLDTEEEHLTGEVVLEEVGLEEAVGAEEEVVAEMVAVEVEEEVVAEEEMVEEVEGANTSGYFQLFY